MALKIENLPKELLDNYKQGRCGLFIGAGVSQGSGLPSWIELILSLIDRGEADNSIDPEKAQEYKELANETSKYLMLAQELKEVLGHQSFGRYIKEIFLDESLTPSEVHNVIVGLKNSRFIITTNYDELIERAFVSQGVYKKGLTFLEAHTIQGKLYQREFFILKAHGDANSVPDEIILTDKDYRRLMYQHPGYQSVLQTIFTMYSVIFVGSSLEDPELKLLLNYINAAFPQGGNSNYALMEIENTSETEVSRWKKDYNMTIIPISSNNNYEDVNLFFNYLSKLEQETA